MVWLPGNISSILKRNNQAQAQRLDRYLAKIKAAHLCHFTPAILAPSSHDNPLIPGKLSDINTNMRNQVLTPLLGSLTRGNSAKHLPEAGAINFANAISLES